ncbi:hypothetical protein DITRI_Ditri04bG0091800 [Diplodiscus trichospermus]
MILCYQTIPNIPQRVSRLHDQKEDGCPDGKVPIHSNPLIRPLNDINSGVKYSATISTPPGQRSYGGGSAIMGVFNPAVDLMQSSRANIWVQNCPASDLNSIEVGWAVHSNLYGDNYTRLTAYWTADNFQTTGCYNVLCPGNWWLLAQMEYLIVRVGYWPKEIFTYLALGADVVKYGGTTSTYIDQLDRPAMGNGKYPGDMGWVYGFFRWVRYVNESYSLTLVEHSEMIKALDSICYGLMYPSGPTQENMKFGGPGGTIAFTAMELRDQFELINVNNCLHGNGIKRSSAITLL